MRKSTISRLGLALLCSLMLGLLMVGTAGAETTGTTPDGFTYSIQGDAATITGYTGSETAISIPAEVAGISVISIGWGAFYDSDSLTSVSIPSSVTSIGWGAFQNCSGLTDLTLLSNSISIHSFAFEGCDALTSLSYISSNGTYFMLSFSGYFPNLTSVTVLPGSASIADGQFKERSKLTNVTIPEGVTSIGREAFKNCSGLTSITIPASLTSIGSYAFDGCSGLTSLTILNGVTDISDAAFRDCSGLSSLVLPESVTRIGNATFAYCSGLTSIYIPSGVRSIGANAFKGCSGLTDISLPHLLYLGSSAFEGCSGLTSLTMLGVDSIEAAAFKGCVGLTSVSLPSGVRYIGASAFSGCTGLESILIPSSVIGIDDSAFLQVSSPFIVYGTIGSEAQAYADRLGHRFIDPNFTIPVKGISFADAELTILIDSQRQLSVIFEPQNTNETKIIWSNSNPGVADVSTDGVLTAFATGGGIITARAANGSQASLIFLVKTVYDMSSVRWDYVGPFTYDGTEKSIQVIGLPAGVFVASYSGNTGSESGTYTAAVNFSYFDLMYFEPIIAPLSWSIGKAQGNVSIIGDIGKVFDGKPVDEPVFTVDGDGAVTVSYYVGTSADGDLSALPLTGAPMNAGSYTVKVSAAEGTNHLPAEVDRAFTIRKASYDMSGVAWDYEGSFSFDGTVKPVTLTSLPAGLTPVYTGNTAMEAGSYTASVTFTYDMINYEQPMMPDLSWAIELAADPKLPGDANGDNAIDILDLVSIIDNIVSNTSPASLANADANGDGTVDILDLVWIIDKIVGS